MKIEENYLYDYEGLKIYQKSDAFKFSVDSLLLAEFVNILPSTKLLVDFCTGNAPIPLILSKNKNINILGIEIQKNISDLAQSTIELNKISNIKIINDNIKNIHLYLENDSVDIVTCNPPYFMINEKSYVNKNLNKSIARHEIEITIDEIITLSYKVLKTNGKLYLVHRVERLNEIVKKLEKSKFALKTLQFIYSKKNKNAIIVLIEASKNGKEGLKVNPPILLSELQSYQNIFK